jgi:large subunit ribosomal protein L10
MTSTSIRSEKVAVVSEVREKLAASDAAIVTEYRGMTVAALAQLRRELRKSGAEYKVYKNTLARFAAREAGYEGLESMLVGPSAIVFVKGDAAAAAKALREQAKANPLLIVKGGVVGTSTLTFWQICHRAKYCWPSSLVPCRLRSSRPQVSCRHCLAIWHTA